MSPSINLKEKRPMSMTLKLNNRTDTAMRSYSDKQGNLTMTPTMKKRFSLRSVIKTKCRAIAK
jgi:hypothetical protein